MNVPIQNIVIFGDGYETLLCALYVKRKLNNFCPSITVIQSNTETSSRWLHASNKMRLLHSQLQVSEPAFVKETKAEINLGVELSGFNTRSSSIFTHEAFGISLHKRRFQYLFKYLLSEDIEENIENYCLSACMARSEKFTPPTKNTNSIYSSIDYGYSLNKSSYTKYLEQLCKNDGIEFHQAEIETCERNNQGMITEIGLSSGTKVGGDFYLDCSNDRRLFNRITEEGTRKPALPFTILPSARDFKPQHSKPYRTLIATSDSLALGGYHSGGYVTESLKLNKELTTTEMDSDWIELEPWQKNCIAIGPAGINRTATLIGEFELLHHSLDTLMSIWPRTSNLQAENDIYNKVVTTSFKEALELDQFLLALAFARPDYIPPDVQRRLETFSYNGSSIKEDSTWLNEQQWSTLLYALGYTPRFLDVSILDLEGAEIKTQLQKYKAEIIKAVDALPSYHVFLQKVH